MVQRRDAAADDAVAAEPVAARVHAVTDTVVAVHTGGYRLGRDGVICGRITSLNHRIDLPDVLAWITANDV